MTGTAWFIAGFLALFIGGATVIYIGDLQAELVQAQRLSRSLADESWHQWFVYAIATETIHHDPFRGRWIGTFGSATVAKNDLLEFVDACRRLEAAQALHIEIEQITA